MMSSRTRSGRAASQRPDEIGPFIDFLRQRKVRRYLEIGARHGDTFYEVMSALPKGSKGVAVDMPGGPWGQKKSRGFLDAAAIDLRNDGYDVAVVYGDSAAPHIIDRISDLGLYDAVLIDGDHSLEGVSADWCNFRQMARIVAFHDIDGFGQIDKATGNPVEVPALWAEIKQGQRTVEFIGVQRGMGIGVVLQ